MIPQADTGSAGPAQGNIVCWLEGTGPWKS